ncbi:PREDICTED: multiple epidermal growth factor-like domains protein 10, partial [Habropoda laboriosa]|uniref:multiple epidermal growth factor-like domains protein 10 n=1 Tax=Habropoda laboriosa TaxID=597456 RepID=UPI00083CE67C
TDRNVFVNDIVDWKCETSADCYVNLSSCVDGTCQCPSGYIYNGNMTSCIKVARRYGDDCEESIQCSRYLFSGAFCMKKTCVCSEGYYYMHGRCNEYSGLSEKCRKDYDCYTHGVFNAMSCVNGICKCSSNFYQREYRSCRPAAKGVRDKCVIDNDCKQFNNAANCQYDNTCALEENNTVSEFLNNNNILQKSDPTSTVTKCTVDADCKDLGDAFCEPSGTCICKRAHFFNEESNKCVPELGESCQPGDEPNIEYSECRNGIWNCELDRAVSKNNQKCEKATKKYNSYCNSDINCHVFGPDAICENNNCVCNENSRFVESELFCWTKRGISETCHKDIDCYINETDTKLHCKDNFCSCPDGTHPNFNKTDCIHFSAGIGSVCETDMDCTTKNAECANNVCTCRKYYYLSNDQCLPGIASSCDNDTDCKPENSECRVGHCYCLIGYVAESINSCLPVAAYGDSCEKDIQCSAELPNAVCLHVDNSISNTTNSTCACAEGYHYNYLRCHKRRVLGMSCMNLAECYLDSGDRVVCKNGRCACDSGYIQVNNTVCKEIQRYNINDGSIRINTMGLIPILLWMINFLI